MLWNFYIIDRNGVNHTIEEPVGWDANSMQLVRDPEWHGIFFTDIGNTFQFFGNARDLLKAEYDQYGVQGQMTLVMQEDCGSGLEEFSRGNFMFKNYEFCCGDECYVKIPLEASNEVMDLRNRINQDVDLDSNVAFDGTTALTAYDKLNFLLTLPSKTILLQNKAEWAVTQNETPSLDAVAPGKFDTSPTGNYNYAWFNIVPQFETVDLSEFGTFATDNYPNTQFICKASFYNMALCPTLERVVPGNMAYGTLEAYMVLFDPDINTALLYYDPNNVNNFDAVKKFDVQINFQGTITPIWASITAFYITVIIKRATGTYDYLDKIKIINAQWDGSGGIISSTYWGDHATHNFSHIGTYNNITLNPGDYLFCSICGVSRFRNTDIALNKDMFTVNFTGGSVIMKAMSRIAPNNAKVYFINEVISRVAESITNNKLKAYSEYFGRTDSQPYTVTSDGDGSLEVVTDGLRIRNQENRAIAVVSGVTSPITNKFTICLKDLFDGLCPIHNIGVGVEPDTNRIGYNRLRVENWKYFYNNSVVMSCTDIDKITRKSNSKEIYSTFQFGYQKWESEQYNGLDEFLTMANYRTTLNQVFNNFVKTSKFIASGYAIEVTRRKSNDSTDWRYDNDFFVICVTRSRVIASGFADLYFWASTLFEFRLTTPLPTVLQIGDIITFPSSTINTGTYTVIALYDDGLTNVGGYYYPRVGLNPLISPEYWYNGSFHIIRNKLCVEQGNVSNALNILDPDTIYNYRISPIRNALRWMNRVFTSYKQFNTDSKVLFTDGNGNYYAQGEMTDTVAKLENGVVAENQMINSAIYADTNNAKPISLAERITFDYPMNSRDYKNIETNPYGLIYFSNDCEEGYGWIDTISYKPEQGIATFTLIPKMI